MQDKVVLITGIGSGMGRAAALRFASEGALVVGCDLFQDTAEETARLVREAGYELHYQAPVDLSDAQGAKAWIDWAITIHGRADVLYNNASSPRFGDVHELSVDDWDFTINNELNLVFYTVKAIWPHFMEHGGVVLNIASIAGTRGVEFMSQNAHGTAKGGVISLTQQLAAEGGKYGIRAVSISPGFIVTPSTAWLVDSGPQPLLDNLARIPLGRPGQPEDIVNAALFLASEEAQWITGVNLVVDGGGTVLG
ncbi:SDR family NAD(P)-dependent oxidoreductase [Glutamicibacter uratoxydans]|uniref:SDR family NAD(P)-dependent oxidoreductase n=1 Tax=Glutamicibacter uratoxydans TaxID=43667 RepID=UPI003D6DEE0B